MSDDTTYGFGGAEPTPARPAAADLASSLLRLQAADKALKYTKERVPDYTGQWDASDYYAEEQEEYNRACDAYADAIQALVSPPSVVRGFGG